MAISTPMVNLPNLYVNGLFLQWQSATQILTYGGQARDSTNVNDIFTGQTMVDATLQGAGGLDTGAIADNTYYAVYVIGNTYNNVNSQDYNDNNSALIISADLVQPLLPFGYDMFRRIGYILTDDSGNILKFWQEGILNSTLRKMWYDSPIQVLMTGTSATFVNFSVALAVPSVIGTNVTLQCVLTPTAPGDSVSFRPALSVSTNGMAVISGDVAALPHVDNIDMISLGTGSPVVPRIGYKVTGSVDVYVAAYVDQL